MQNGTDEMKHILHFNSKILFPFSGKNKHGSPASTLKEYLVTPLSIPLLVCLMLGLCCMLVFRIIKVAHLSCLFCMMLCVKFRKCSLSMSYYDYIKCHCLQWVTLVPPPHLTSHLTPPQIYTFTSVSSIFT